MLVWQWFHFRFGHTQAVIEPLGVERLYLDNYFSIAKAKRDLGYQPLFTTEQAMDECLPYYADLFHQMKAAGKDPAVSVAAAPLEGYTLRSTASSFDDIAFQGWPMLSRA